MYWLEMRYHLYSTKKRPPSVAQESQMSGPQVMGDVNAKVDAAQTAKVMQEFARQNEFMNMKEDMIGDALQDAVRIHTCNRRWFRWIYGLFVC